MELVFSSVEELKIRLMPALRIRKKELKRKNIIITEEELWNYFVSNFWKKSTNLTLAKMTDDILNQETEFEKYNV